MIFKQWELVLDGRKTQTRRMENQGDVIELSVVRTGAGRKRFWLFQHLPIIPKRGQKAIRDAAGHIQRVEVKRIHREYLQDITEDDAIAEGVQSVEDYKTLWQSINGKTKGACWDDNPLVWVLTFEAIKA